MLSVENLSVRFGKLTAVNNVSLTVASDEVVGLVGPNGAGKTTLFNAISGLVAPAAGRLLFQGRHIKRMPLYKRARLGIGRTFQVPQPLHELTVYENLLVAQRFGAGRVDKDHLREVMEFTGIAAKANEDAASGLSLSELKALEVSKALVTRPQLLLLDEVLAGLETSGKRRFMEMLRRLHSQFGIGILIIEHDIETVSNLCHRVAVLDQGELIANDTPAEVFRDPRVIRSYTGEAHA